ncbi:MAG: hypothetical protein IJN82_06845 [Clostridia bacterium]|nr:hypothetical protein [Clostridia bacterium]MBQ7090819.1 hypothetical protein [Clostridia bacterium]
MKERTKNILALSLLCLGVIALLGGLFRGEAAEVLKKATMICLECIGIG